MTLSGTLWTTPVQGKGRVIKAVAALAGIEITLPADYDHFVDNKKPEFLAKFPNGKVPAWEGSDGFRLFEGAAIARYLAALAPDSVLLGTSIEEGALVDQWSRLAESEVAFLTDFIRGLCESRYPYNKTTHTILVERQTLAFKTLEEHISTRTFFVGERITLADLAVASFIQKAVGVTFDKALRAKMPNLIRHLNTIVNQPKLKDVFGEVDYIDIAFQFVPAPKETKKKDKASAK